MREGWPGQGDGGRTLEGSGGKGRRGKREERRREVPDMCA